MLTLSEIFLLSIALAADGSATSWFSSALHRKLGIVPNYRLTVILPVVRVLFLLPGMVAGYFLSSVLEQYTFMSGLSVLSIVGIKLGIESIKFYPEEKVILIDNNKTLLLVTIAGSINTLIAGTGLGLIGTAMVTPSVITLLAAAGFCFAGIKAGMVYGYRPSARYIGLFSGILILSVTLRQFILHLIN